MVDTLALGASTERCVGSSPTFDTKKGSVVLNEQNFCLLSREMSVRIRLDPQTPRWWNGRHEGLKIPWAVMSVRVRVPLSVLVNKK
jgi:hypothetical protein